MNTTRVPGILTPIDLLFLQAQTRAPRNDIRLQVSLLHCHQNVRPIGCRDVQLHIDQLHRQLRGHSKGIR